MYNAGTLYCHPHDAFPDADALEILTVNLNVGSVAAFTGHLDPWFGASKTALLNVTKSYAAYLGPDGVLVNAVAPGPTLSATYDRLPESRKEAVMRSVHSGRPARPEGVAQA